ncbi:unnamed protein product, partial [Ilex paraguariensis]
LKSLYRSCRRYFACSDQCHCIQANRIISRKPPTSLLEPLSHDHCLDGGRAAVKAYWERSQQLEQEIVKLDEWLNTKKMLRDSINSLQKIERSRKYCVRNGADGARK